MAPNAVRTAAEQIHLPTPRGEREPAYIHETTKAELKKATDHINEHVGHQVVTMDDLVRISLSVAANAPALASEDPGALSEDEKQILTTLGDMVDSAVDGRILYRRPPQETDSGGSGGED